jgi:hypothetical protein
MTFFIVGDKIIDINLNLTEEILLDKTEENKEIYNIINIIKDNILIENDKLILSYGTDVSKELKKITNKTLNSLAQLKDIDFSLSNLNNKKPNEILAELELIQFTLLKNNRLLHELKITNKESYLKLFLYIESGKSKIIDLQLNNKNFKESEIFNKIKLFEKQLEDLNFQQMLSLNNQSQIEDLENTNKQLIKRINELKQRFK